MAAIPRRVLEQLVETRLQEIDGLTVYRRRVGYVHGQQADVPPPVITPGYDLRVRPYVVQYPSAGMTGPFERLDWTRKGLEWTTQLTCVVGDETALNVLVDHVTSRLDEWRPVLPAEYAAIAHTGRFRMLNDPGPGRRDDSESPARYWTPLVYSLLINH